MTREGWREALLEASRRHCAGDSSLLDLMAELLTEQDQARHELRELGYGCIGRPWLGIVDDIRHGRASERAQR